MKRYLLILFIIIYLLVSCSTTQVKNAETQPEPVRTEVPAAEEQAPVTEDAGEAETTTEEAPETEAHAEEEPVEELPVEEQPAEEQPVPEQEVTEENAPEAAASEEIVEEEISSDEQDWSQVIGAAPSDEPVQEEPEVVKEAEVPAPKAEKPQSSPKASNPSFVDRLTSLIKRTGNFIADEILLSIGIFVCVGGFVYLVAALAISSRRERQKRATRVRKAPKENTAFEPGQDKDPESDDDFLKSLLGDDSN